ncbi:hypothetical protein HDU67_003447, partial [Dinochytrium kinnereticum]
MTDPFYLTPTVPARPEEETVKLFKNVSKLGMAINANFGDKRMAMVGENWDYLNKAFGTGSQISLALMQHKLDEITWIDNDYVTYVVSRAKPLQNPRQRSSSNKLWDSPRCDQLDPASTFAELKEILIQVMESYVKLQIAEGNLKAFHTEASIKPKKTKSSRGDDTGNYKSKDNTGNRKRHAYDLELKKAAAPNSIAKTGYTYSALKSMPEAKRKDII